MGWGGDRRFLSPPPQSGLAPQPLELQAPNCQHRTIVEHEVPGSVLMFVPGMLPEMRLKSSQLHRNSQGTVLGWSKDFWKSKDVEPVWISKINRVSFSSSFISTKFGKTRVHLPKKYCCVKLCPSCTLHQGVGRLPGPSWAWLRHGNWPMALHRQRSCYHLVPVAPATFFFR